jgi:hypothetical protein
VITVHVNPPREEDFLMWGFSGVNSYNSPDGDSICVGRPSAGLAPRIQLVKLTWKAVAVEFVLYNHLADLARQVETAADFDRALEAVIGHLTARQILGLTRQGIEAARQDGFESGRRQVQSEVRKALDLPV